MFDFKLNFFKKTVDYSEEERSVVTTLGYTTKIMVNNGPFPRPPRSPYLSILDHFIINLNPVKNGIWRWHRLFGYQEANVTQDRTTTLQHYS